MRRPLSRHNNGGYTLIELLVATSIMMLIIVGMLTFLVNSIVGNARREARSDLLREAQLALDVMVGDIRLSANVDDNNRIEDPNSPDAAATNGFGWESDADTLILATAVEDNSGTIIFQDEAHYITEKNNLIYYVLDGILYKRTLAADVADNASTTTCPPDEADSVCPADRLSVENVSSLQLRYYDAENNEVPPSNARSVEATLSLQAVKFGRTIDVSYSTRTVFRNE